MRLFRRATFGITVSLKSAMLIGLCMAYIPTTAEQLQDSASNKRPTASKKLFDYHELTGRAREAYERAAEIPDVLDQPFCYCGCNITDRHRTALDCFTTAFAADMTLCQEEALLAYSLHKKGYTLKQIQAEVASTFGKLYPFEEKAEAGRSQVITDYERWEFRDFIASGTLRDKPPNDASWHNQRGVELQYRKLYREAIQEYFAAWNLQPKNSNYVVNIASALQEDGQLDVAEFFYKRALTIRANAPGAEAGLKQISEIRKQKGP